MFENEIRHNQIERRIGKGQRCAGIQNNRLIEAWIGGYDRIDIDTDNATMLAL